jgi:4-hydroxybenzoate polyprenyltransferase
MHEQTRAWLQLLRAPALFTAWSNILAAHLIATGGHPHWPSLLLLTAASSALYLGGMVLNDCFDLDEDRRERPFRPLPSGRIPPRQAWRLGAGLLVTGFLLAALNGTQSMLIALLLLLAIIGYDSWLKRHPVGTLVMGSCRYLNWLLGLSAVPLSGNSLLLPLPILLYVTALTTLSRVETGGESRRNIGLAIAGILTAMLCLIPLYRLELLQHYWPLLPALLLLFLLLRSLLESYRDPTPEGIQRNMKMLLLGIIPLDALLVLAGTAWWGGLVILLLLIPGYFLARIIYIT